MLSDVIKRERYFQKGETSWDQVITRVESIFDAVGGKRELKDRLRWAMTNNYFIPGGRILRNAGLPHAQLSNCFLFQAEDSKYGWGDLMKRSAISLMTGGGIGAEYGQIRPSGTALHSSQGIASGPLPLIKSINEIGRGVQCGGFRRSAIYGSLPWYHPDIFEFIHLKDWPAWLQEQKKKDMDVAAPGDMTNISVRLDRQFFSAYADPNHSLHNQAYDVYWEVIDSMVRTGEPGFQVDFDEQILRNACTEIISATDNDSCVLGNVNFGAVPFIHLEEVVDIGQAFLLAVTEANWNPTPETRRVQRENRRLGLGPMGIGEWYLQNEILYGDPRIKPWLHIYKTASDRACSTYADLWHLPHPIAARCVAPTGTTSIVAETTSGCEPLMAPAYERRYRSHRMAYETQVVIDPVALRLQKQGIPVEEYAWNIPAERRIAFQAMLQGYVDNAISSTVNLPDTHQDPVAFGETLMKYLPLLRGITCFPNGSRGLQPITPVSMDYALQHNPSYESSDNACPSGVCAL